MSPSRSRPKVLVRDISAADDFTLLGNAISTNFRLRHSNTFGSVPRFGNREGATQLVSAALHNAAPPASCGQILNMRKGAAALFRMDHKDFARITRISGQP